MEEERRDVISNLRAIIISFKGALPLANINRDYLEAFGEKVPLAAVGYSSLRELFEKNSSDFILVGDKVEAVQKTNSAHISSLVERQKSGKSVKCTRHVARRRPPRSREGGLSHSHPAQNKSQIPPRFAKLHDKNIFQNEKECSKPQSRTDAIENITLRKPRDVKQISPGALKPSTDHFATTKLQPLMEIDLKSFSKTIMNDKYAGPMEMRIEYSEPFKDVEDLPTTTSAQSRLLRKRYQMLQDLKSSENQQKTDTDSSQPLEMLFDLDSINYPTVDTILPLSLPSPPNPFPDSGTPSPTCSESSITISRQKAQARFANIKSALQTSNIAASKTFEEGARDASLRKGINVNTKENELIERIFQIIGPTYGIWSDKLPALYEDMFNEELRKDWLKIISEASCFDISSIGDGRFIIRKISDIDSSVVESVKQRERQGDIDQRYTWNKPKLLDLKTPDSEYWEIYVTNIKNSDEIWCRLIGEEYSDAYDTMMTKLELEPPERIAVKSIVGQIYTIKVSAIWYRVKLVELIGEDQGLIFYIDVGDQDVVHLSELYEPEEILFSVAPQALMLSLYELGSFSSDEELTSVISGNLLGNTYIAEIISESCDVKRCHSNRKTARLWDTSTERDINVNQLLLNNIIKNITLPSLPSIGQIKEVFVASVSVNGEIHIQTNKRSMHHLKCLISNKIKSINDDKQVNRLTRKTIGTDIMYATKCKNSGIFCRVKIIEIQDSDTVDVLFVDYGFVERVVISDLIHLEKSSILQAIPAQVIKVKLANVTNFRAYMVPKLRQLVLDQSVLMKVTSTNRGSVPSVEFFKRAAAGNGLYSVNMKLNNDPELKNSDSPTRRKSVVVGLEKVLPEKLRPPRIPDVGQYFDVFVTLASSPDLFIVQPLASRVQLLEMMNELQSICGSQNTSSVGTEDFAVGELYAVQHPDGNWYRGCAQAVVGSCNYSVYLCDFGDCIMVTKDKLKRLPHVFQTFPYQAIRATLLGIPQECRDWTPVDCVTFHKLVVEKYFVSTVIEIQRDERNPNYVSLGLTLTDTSGEEDVQIHKILMEKKNEAFTFIKSLSNS